MNQQGDLECFEKTNKQTNNSQMTSHSNNNITNNDPFGYLESDLQKFYNLKDLNPMNSWINDSIIQFDLNKYYSNNDSGNVIGDSGSDNNDAVVPKNTSYSMINSLDMESVDSNLYEILKDLVDKQQIINNHSNSNNNDMIDDNGMQTDQYFQDVKDPLNQKHLLKDFITNNSLTQDNNNNNNIRSYLINQKSFDVKKFLKDIHSKDTFQDLTKSLDDLNLDLQSQSVYLQDLVEKNFIKYVKIKNRLDSIYKQFYQNTSTSGVNNNSNTSIGKTTFSTANNPTNNPMNIDVENLNERVKESIRSINLKLKPLIDTKTKISNYSLTKQFIEYNKDYFNLPKDLNNLLYSNDYQNFILQYNKGVRLYEDLNNTYDLIPLSEKNSGQKQQQTKIIELIWNQVENIRNSYRDQIWNKLINSSINESNEFISLLSKLLDLKIESNPIPDLVHICLTNIENDFIQIIKKSFKKIIVAQKNILNINVNDIDSNNSNTINELQFDENDGVDLSYYTLINENIIISPYSRTATTTSIMDGEISNYEPSNNTTDFFTFSNISNLGHSSRQDLKESSTPILSSVLTDSPLIIEMWLIILKYINDLTVTINKFIESWENIDKFLNNTYQRMLANDKKKDDILIEDNVKAENNDYHHYNNKLTNGASHHNGNEVSIDEIEEFLKLTQEEKNEIKHKGEKIINLLCNNLLSFFQSTQETLPSVNIKNDTITTDFTNNLNERTDNNQYGVPSNYGFIPPRANGLSCLRYLPMILEPMLKSFSNIAQLSIDSSINSSIKRLSTIIIERCIGALSSTKLRDISRFYLLENWKITTKIQEITDNRNSSTTTTNNYYENEKSGKNYEFGVTRLPDIVLGFQQFSIQTVRDILFAYERLPTVNNICIVSPPTKKMLIDVEIQQIISLEAVLEAILKNATKDKNNPRNVHTLLTLTNLEYIKEVTFPETLNYFDDLFEWNLKDKPLEIFNLLDKMKKSIFGNYISDLKINLKNILESKFHQIDWINYTSNSFRVSDYIIESLMLLITIHSECFKVGPQLINKILKETQLFISRYLFESFKSYVGKISSDGLLQLCVDITFFQEVLGKLLEQETKVTLKACLQNCFQNHIEKMDKCVIDMEPIVQSNLNRTKIQFAAFK